MPTSLAAEALAEHDVRAFVRAHVFGAAGGVDQRGVGLEVEVLPVHRQVDGPERGTWTRTRLVDSAARLDTLATAGTSIGARDGRDSLSPWPAASGRLTFEPGGQLEYSGGVHASGAAAMDELDLVMGRLAAAWSDAGGLLLSAGIDVWTDHDEVPQQLRAGRYEAMDAHLGVLGPAGRRMMRHTCALQVNVDPGRGVEAAERWQLANLVAPLTTATFACSPAADRDPAVSIRARTWRQLDPSRTGVAGVDRLGGSVDRVESYLDFVLAADVLLVAGPHRQVLPGRPALRFGDWLRDGDAELQWPTLDDLRVHLTTLFPEVRPRGSLELRSIDALPARWRAAPTVLLTGLLYDAAARSKALRLLVPRAGRLRDDLVRAGEVGLKDPELCAVAVEIWSLAREGAQRLGPGWHRPQDLHTAGQFIDHFTMRGRCPADELRERLDDDLVAALSWAAEPAADLVRQSR